MAYGRLYSLIFLSIFSYENGQGIRMIVDTVKKVGTQPAASSWNHKNTAGAVVSIAIAALVQLNESLIVVRKFWK